MVQFDYLYQIGEMKMNLYLVWCNMCIKILLLLYLKFFIISIYRRISIIDARLFLIVNFESDLSSNTYIIIKGWVLQYVGAVLQELTVEFTLLFVF